jgi:hypothetical protein
MVLLILKIFRIKELQLPTFLKPSQRKSCGFHEITGKEQEVL